MPIRQFGTLRRCSSPSRYRTTPNPLLYLKQGRINSDTDTTKMSIILVPTSYIGGATCNGIASCNSHLAMSNNTSIQPAKAKMVKGQKISSLAALARLGSSSAEILVSLRHCLRDGVTKHRTVCTDTSIRYNKKAQLSLTNPRDACKTFARFT